MQIYVGRDNKSCHIVCDMELLSDMVIALGTYGRVHPARKHRLEENLDRMSKALGYMVEHAATARANNPPVP